MRELYGGSVSDRYKRSCWLLDDERHVIDCYGDLQGTEWVLTMYFEAVTQQGMYERDVYYLDEERTDRIATWNLVREYIAPIPSWEHFLENVESYLMLAALS